MHFAIKVFAAASAALVVVSCAPKPEPVTVDVAYDKFGDAVVYECRPSTIPPNPNYPERLPICEENCPPGTVPNHNVVELPLRKYPNKARLSVVITDPASGTFGQNLNIDAVEEIEVITSGASAEYGRADGGFANNHVSLRVEEAAQLTGRGLTEVRSSMRLAERN